MNRNLMRQAATLLGAVGQAGVPAILGRRIAENAGDERSMIEPAGWAFAIWQPIFGLFVRYAVFQGRAANRDRVLLRRVGCPTASALIGDVSWEILVAGGRLLPAQGVILAIAGSADLSLRRLAAYEREHGLEKDERWSVAVPIGLLAGWTTAAAAVSVSNELVRRGPVPRGGLEKALGSATLLGLGALGAATIRVSGGRRSLASRSYAAAVLWAFAAVVLKQGAASRATRAAALAAGVPVVFALVDRGRSLPSRRRP